MNRRALLIKIAIAAVLIIAAGVYYGLDSQYFGKTLESHISAIVLFIAVVSGMLVLSEWYNSKTR